MTTLKAWFDAAVTHGTVYYVAHVSKSGMHARYTLYTIADGQLVKAWPDKGEGFDAELASKLGFSLKKRAWVRNGCGYNRVHDILDSMASLFGKFRGDLPRQESLHDS